MSTVKAIYARASNGVMGAGNTLPWSVPADMKRFRGLTSGCIVIMGFKTWLSLGCRPLPHRENVVIVDGGRLVPTSALHDDVRFVTSLDAAIGMYRGDSRTLWVIGGPMLVARAMDDYDAEVHRTTLGLLPDGDVVSDVPDAKLNTSYARVGYEELRCHAARTLVVFERFVKAGINAGLK